MPILVTAALALALQAQTMGGPFAAAWLLPFLGACGVAVYPTGADRTRGPLWWAGLA